MKEVWYQLTGYSYYMNKAYEYQMTEALRHAIRSGLTGEPIDNYEPKEMDVRFSECGKFFTFGEMR